MKKIIKLHSRYGEKNWLEHYRDKTYILHSETDHIRVGYQDADMQEIEFVDPPGGPFMSVGDKVAEANSIIETIEVIKGKGIAITFV